MLDAIEKNLLKEVAELDSLPVGAYNIRANGQLESRNTTANIDIVSKTDKPGIDIYIRPFTKNESVHIPVILSQTGLKDLVYNDFHIGEGADVTIIAGCGIHNCGGGNAQHDGIHTFWLAKNAKLRYVEKHYGEGDGRGKQIMNPTTIVHLAEGAQMEMETTQIAGIDDTIRKTSGTMEAGASLVVKEKIMTTGDQHAVTDFVVDLWKRDAQDRNTARIVKTATDLYNQLCMFVDDFEKVGKSIEKASADYAQAYKRMCHGNNNVIRLGERMRGMGLRPKKRISDKALDEASLPTEAEEDMPMIDGGREEGGNE